MKKFTKIVLIIAAICLGLGIVTSVAGVMSGGQVFQVRRRVMQQYGADRRAEQSTEVIRVETEELETDKSDAENKTVISPGEGTAHRRELEITILAGGIQVVQEEELEDVEVRNLSPHLELTKKADGESLELIFNGKRGIHLGDMDGDIHGTVAIPADHSFNEISFEVKAGAVFVDSVTARNLEIEIGAGVSEMTDVAADRISIDCLAGALNFYGTPGQLLEIDLEAGALDMLLPGRAEAYNYQLDINAGRVEIDGESYKGFRRETFLENPGAECLIDLESDAGTAVIEFEE